MELRCECKKLLAEVVSPPYRIKCHRCGKVAEMVTEKRPRDEKRQTTTTSKKNY